MPQKRKDLKIKGANLWYLVGLITSDGCLSKSGKDINITSKDFNFLEKLKAHFGLINKIGTKNRGKINQAYYIQISNKNLYEFMLSIGLTPRKSLTLKELGVPEKYFFDFLRGLIDGDGCIRRWIHPFNGREQWSLRIFSGSTAFINWLSQRMSLLLSAKGKIYRNSTQSRCYVLKFGKMAARNIAMQCYYPGAFALERKSVLADECVNSYIGWSKSKTVLN